ncbi:MAG: aldehyde dehydrogenase family protein, partial [bacterium]
MAAPAKPAPDAVAGPASAEVQQTATHLDSIDPASGEVIGRFEITSVSELPQIVERVRRVQEAWAEQPVRAHCASLRRLRDVLYQRREEITEVVTRESGKPRFEALTADLMVSLDTADYYARELPRLLRSERVQHHNLAVKAKRGTISYEPMGVLGVISPWNYPLAIPLGLLIPAVAAGNAVVLKPSELTPWCGALMGELFEQAGFPAGLVQVVQGRGEVGAALIEAKPDKVIFTGSVATGQRVAEACARLLVPSVLELGGKDAMIVLADANLEVASSAAVWGSFTNCGQACLSVERIYVERTVAERFTELCVTKTKKLRLGSGLHPENEVGPMIRASQVEKVERHLQDAVSRGARILAGGKRRPDLGPCFFEPTVVAEVDHSMLLMHEETFGPVLAVRAVANAEEAVRLANDSPFGLGASVWTRDARRGRQIASQLKVGAVMINDALSY